MDMVRLLRAAFLIFALFAMGACSSLQNKKHASSFEQQYATGQYMQAADSALLAGAIQPDGTSKDLLWSLQGGLALSAGGQYAFSTRVFDTAEALMKEEDLEGIGRKGVEQVTAIFVNNKLNRYTPTVYDGVMTNTYKALNSVFLKDYQGARIEFNRAADRQRRAEEFFKAKLEKQKEKLAEDETSVREAASSSTPGAFDFKKSLSESELAVYQQYPELQEWKAYPNYVNPYTDYLHGLYFMLSGKDGSDFGKARDSMRRVAGMNPNNKAIETDLKVADKLVRGEWGKSRLNPAVWVVFENGLAPLVEETVIPLPLFIVGSNLDYAQVALPKLKVRDQAYPYLELFDAQRSMGKTELLASMDRVIQTEFKKEFPFKATQAISSSLVKAYLQYQAKKEGGDAASLLFGVYQLATTHADTRSWTALPKEIQLARIKKPSSNQLTITAPGLLAPLQVELPKNRFSVVYVKASTADSQPTYRVVGFDA